MDPTGDTNETDTICDDPVIPPEQEEVMGPTGDTSETDCACADPVNPPEQEEVMDPIGNTNESDATCVDPVIPPEQEEVMDPTRDTNETDTICDDPVNPSEQEEIMDPTGDTNETVTTCNDPVIPLEQEEVMDPTGDTNETDTICVDPVIPLEQEEVMGPTGDISENDTTCADSVNPPEQEEIKDPTGDTNETGTSCDDPVIPPKQEEVMGPTGDTSETDTACADQVNPPEQEEIMDPTGDTSEMDTTCDDPVNPPKQEEIMGPTGNTNETDTIRDDPVIPPEQDKVKGPTGDTNETDTTCNDPVIPPEQEEAMGATGDTSETDCACAAPVNPPEQEEIMDPTGNTNESDATCVDPLNPPVQDEALIPIGDTSETDTTCIDPVIPPEQEEVMGPIGDTSETDTACAEPVNPPEQEEIMDPTGNTNDTDTTCAVPVNPPEQDKVKGPTGDTNETDTTCDDPVNPPEQEEVMGPTGDTNESDATCVDPVIPPEQEEVMDPTGDTNETDTTYVDPLNAPEQEEVMGPTGDTNETEITCDDPVNPPAQEEVMGPTGDSNESDTTCNDPVKPSEQDEVVILTGDTNEIDATCVDSIEQPEQEETMGPTGDRNKMDTICSDPGNSPEQDEIVASTKDVNQVDTTGALCNVDSDQQDEATGPPGDTNETNTACSDPVNSPEQGDIMASTRDANQVDTVGESYHVDPPEQDKAMESTGDTSQAEAAASILVDSSGDLEKPCCVRLSPIGESPCGSFHEKDSPAVVPKDNFTHMNGEKTDSSPEQITQRPVSRLFEHDYQEFLQQLEKMKPVTNVSDASAENRRKTIDETLQQLNMERYRTSKLSLTDVLKIGKETFKKTIPQNIEDIPWYFLQNLMTLDGSARNTRLDQNTLDVRTSNGQEEDLDFMNEFDTSNSIHPLDVMCLLFLCSDSFLQQEIMTKMSMCQFAVPLLLPAGDGTDGTFMLWAMRDIVKRWRPHSLADSKGCREDNLVNIPMPTFSFVKLGRCNLSKSRILNHILSPVQQHHDFFVHQNMEGANVLRELSDGLVEIAWYFPGGRENSDLFQDPMAVTNLRGDLESNWKQFSFLTRVSAAVFIFTESINEKEYKLLLNQDIGDTHYFIIIAPSSNHVSKATQTHIHMLYPALKITRKNVLVKNSSVNDAELVKKLQLIIADLMRTSQNYLNLEDMSHMASDLGIQVDENSEENQNSRTLALEITRGIKDVVEYKNQTLRLQVTLWKNLAKVEKELCRMKKQGSESAEDYRAKLVKKQVELRKKQHDHKSPDGMTRFITAINLLSRTEKHYFLKWMKLYLDAIARHNLGLLQTEYKESCYSLTTNMEKLNQLDERIFNSSLGVEHFFRELGQFYEAERSMVNEGKIEQNQRKYSKVPGIAADLLLDGFPLELIDGDAANIPLQWITDVLTELDHRIGRQCRMRVITVVGVQSTGKSTLLNTMFGLQFPVASGRCTRGAFMTLIKVKDNFQEELGCDFILVIDTEGLKAPELASVEDSYEHDNELATLVVGLSDIAIINMAMENTAEMKDILQIVVHAFLRMKEIGKKPSCQFVHQNVSDVSAHEKNMRDRKKLLEQLDEMTNIAAKMEERSNVTRFSDIMEYDLEEHSWYIPGLWHGVPPMASVNKGYSDSIFQLKKHLFETMKNQQRSRSSQNIHDFIKWIKSLWNAVKYEKFIFSFRNSLVAEAYNQLSITYSELEWNFRKRSHQWMMETENEIENYPTVEIEKDVSAEIKQEMNRMLQEEERIMTEELEKYFEMGCKYAHLIERYREDFFRSVTLLRKEQEDSLGSKCELAIQIQRGRYEIQCVQDSYLKMIEEKASSLLEDCRNAQHKLSDKELESEFERMWNKSISGVASTGLRKRNISQEMLEQLRKDMRHKAGYVNEKLNNVKSLAEFGQNGLGKDTKYAQSAWFKNIPDSNHTQYWEDVGDIVLALINKCDGQITEKTNLKRDYHDTYCQELLNIINDMLNKGNARKLHLTPLFELDVKLVILGRAAPKFQKTHNNFFQDNNPKFCLEKLKAHYFSTFKSIYHEKDESQIRAQRFCEMCLKPAVSEYMYKILGGKIVDDILTSGDSIQYSSRTFFQFTLLKELLEESVFDQYVKYNNHYEGFVKDWIHKYIVNKYMEASSLDPLKSNILSAIIKKVRAVLKEPKVTESSIMSQCLKTFCDKLKKHLVISKQEIKAIMFQNTASPQQFTTDVESFLPQTEEQINADMKNSTIESVLSKVALKPQNELFKKVFGCGKQCPFCKVPCEAGAADHKEHFASVHRPQGLGSYRCKETKALSYSICSTDVVGNTDFQNSDTDWKPRPYRDYRKFYPDWTIQPDPTIGASNYWKFVFKQFNKQFSERYNAKPAEIPEDWRNITKEQALRSLMETFNMS
uniref:VLIG-type G domain-containing protein n=1 Tax=Leptobrachium leishanense TaxID=445787 RepID=A0A8C5Q1R9_9ANUR